MMVRLLKIKDIKLGDDFFKLGGDSLKALQLIQLIKEKLSINLTLKNCLIILSYMSYLIISKIIYKLR